MPIEIRLVQGEACPVIICDVTGEIIRDANQAIAIWSECEGPKKGQVFFVRKSEDSNVLTKRFEAWYPLPLFLHWLLHNSGYAPRDGQPLADGSQCNGTLPT